MQVHLNDIGTQFRLTLKDGSDIIDLSSTTSKDIVFRKPSGTLVTKTASFLTDGTDGIIIYNTVAGDIDEVGTWQIQGIVSFGTSTFHSSVDKFKVHKNLE